MGSLVTRLELEQNLELHFIDGLLGTDCHRELKGMFPAPYYTWAALSPDNGSVDFDSAKEALNFVLEIVEEEGPFDGIMGFSQGATLALALLLRYAIINPLDPPYAICKFAIFFSAVEMKEETGHWEGRLDIPTLHVFDKTDSLAATEAIVAKHCEPGTAKVISHERGHEIPRDSITVNTILAAIQDLQHRAMRF